MGNTEQHFLQEIQIISNSYEIKQKIIQNKQMGFKYRMDPFRAALERFHLFIWKQNIHFTYSI